MYSTVSLLYAFSQITICDKLNGPGSNKDAISVTYDIAPKNNTIGVTVATIASAFVIPSLTNITSRSSTLISILRLQKDRKSPIRKNTRINLPV